MTSIPCLRSKLLMPELPDTIVHSGRIKKLPFSKSKAIFLTAPGGYGKTTATLLSLKENRAHSHWYRLEMEDLFLPVFYTHLIETLYSGIDKSTLNCHRGLSGISNIEEEYSLLNALICQDACIHFANQGSHHYLVFDDFHKVSSNPRIIESVDYFITNTPPNITIVVTSRVETGIASSKTSLMNNIAFITKEDLRFTREETGQLLHLSNINTTPATLDTIHTYVEGWVAGLVLISRIEDPVSFQPLPSLLPGDTNEETLFSYYFSGFLREIEDTKREALAKMSILYEFTCEDLRDIFHLKNPEDLLEWLEVNNLYIQKLMPQPAKYRLHSLFRRELMIYLKKTHSQSTIDSLYARAADHYQRIGDSHAAICFYIKAGQTEKAAGVLSVVGADLFAKGHPEKIMYLTREFPDQVIRSNPYLLFYRGLMLLTSDVAEAYNCFRTSLLLFKDCKDMTYLMNAFGMILIMAFETNDFKYVKSVVPHIPIARVMLSSSVPRKKLLVSGFINLVAEENLKLASFLCKWMEKMTVSEPIWDYSFLIIRGMLIYRTGELKAAYESLPLILNHPVGLASDQWRIIGLVACHNTLWLQRDIAASKRILEEFAALGEKYDSDFCKSFAFRLSAITKYQTRDIKGAVSDMKKVADCYIRYNSPILASAAMITKYLWETESKPAMALVPKAEKEFLNIPEQGAGHGYYELCQGMMGAIYKAAGDYEKAESCLLSAYQKSLRKNARQHVCAMSMHLADLYDKMQNTNTSEKYLREWAKKSSHNEYVFFHEMDYVTLVRACGLATEKNIYPEHIKKILCLYFGVENAHKLRENPLKAQKDPKEYIAGCSGTTIKEQLVQVNLFGPFSIKINDIMIGEKEWKTRKVRGIIQYILAHAEKTVTRESLSTLFWPESNTKAASTSLRVALYDLRKTLSRFNVGFEDENPLIVEDKKGFRIGKGNVVQTDVQSFRELYHAYSSRNVTEERKELLLAQMIQLYKGDFLEGNFVEEWDLQREYYKSIYIQVSHSLTKMLIKKESFQAAETILEKQLSLDPYDEEGFALLQEIYILTGQNERANALIRQFKKRFKNEIGVEANLEI